MAVIVGTGSIKKSLLVQSGNILAPCAIMYKQWLEKNGMRKNTSQTLTFLHCQSESLDGLTSKKIEEVHLRAR